MNAKPPIDGILETAVDVDDMAAAPAFYEGVLGLPRISPSGSAVSRSSRGATI